MSDKSDLPARYPKTHHRVAMMLESKTWVDPSTGCHIWSGGVNTSGRPFARDLRGRLTTGQRIAYEMENGHIPNGRIVVLCHNRLCVNPEHLSVDPSKRGTQTIL